MKYTVERLEYRRFTQKSEIEKNLNVLEGIIEGISLDSRINDLEKAELCNWIERMSGYRRIKAISEVSQYLQEAISDRVLTEQEKEDLLWLCRQFKKSDTSYYNYLTQEMQVLHGMLHGILADNKINEEEIQGLQTWIVEHEHLQGIYPYDELLSLIIGVTEDGVIDEQEEQLLKVYFAEFIDLSVTRTIDLAEIEKLRKEITVQGICAVDPLIEWEGREFCFTGCSSRVKREELVNIVISTGARYSNSVRKSTNYLVVGDGGNPCWAFSAYGRKVEQAINLRKNGHKIAIVHEVDFWDALDGF